VSKAECEQLKASGYGIKNCYSDNDYWAGAVKQCGHINKMAGFSDLANIANYVYNTSSIGDRDSAYPLTLDQKKAADLGIKTWSNIWINVDNSGSVYGRYFGLDETYVNSEISQGDNKTQVNCITEK